MNSQHSVNSVDIVDIIIIIIIINIIIQCNVKIFIYPSPTLPSNAPCPGCEDHP